MSCKKKPRPSSNRLQEIFVIRLQTPLNFSRISQNVIEPMQKPWKSEEPPGSWPQILFSSIDLIVSHPKWPQREKQCSLSAESTIHWVSFFQPLWMQSCSSRKCPNKKKIATRHSVSTSKRMEQDLWEPDSIVLSAFTQIYWTRRKLHRCLYQSPFSNSIPLLFSKWKSNCQPGVSKASKQLSIPRLELLGVLIGTRCLNYATQQLQLSVVDRFPLTDSQCSSLDNWKTCKPLPVFAQNRLREITSQRDIKFDHVSTSQNPADLATRGVPTDENNVWWHGPSCLTDHLSQWPWPSWKSTQFDSRFLNRIPNRLLAHMLCMRPQHRLEYREREQQNVLWQASCPLWHQRKKFLLVNQTRIRVSAWVLRLIRKLQKKSTITGQLTSE